MIAFCAETGQDRLYGIRLYKREHNWAKKEQLTFSNLSFIGLGFCLVITSAISSPISKASSLKKTQKY
jgi:hypothetical protein